MKYWGLSVIQTSPLMAGVYAIELERSVKTGIPISDGAFRALYDVAANTAPLDAPSLAIVQSEGAPPRRVFLRYPGMNEWLRLERAGITADVVDDGEQECWHLIVDALH